MKIAVTGYKGKLGRRLVALGAFPLDCNVRDRTSVENAVSREKPDIIIHAAAKSSVDYCQDNYSDAWDANVYGANLVAQTAYSENIGVLFLSSDHVFSGTWGNYKESSRMKPKNSYGLMKKVAEALVELWDGKTIRLSRGVSAYDGDISRAFNLMKTSRSFTVPSFFYRNYIHLDFLAEQTWWCASNYHSLPKYLNIGGEKGLSYHDLISRLAKEVGYSGDVNKRRKNYKHLTPRPKNSGMNLGLAKKLGAPMFPTEITIKRLIDEHNSNPDLQKKSPVPAGT